MTDCTEREHHWVMRNIGERGPDGLYEQPVLRFEGIDAEDHIDEVCIHCGAYRTAAPATDEMCRQAGETGLMLVTTYRGD